MTAELLSNGLLVGAAALGLVSIALLWRVVVGPTTADRMVAVNVIGTSVVVIIALLGAGLGEVGFLDVALVYGLLNFLLSLGLGQLSLDGGEPR
ncbi:MULTISPECIES: monovalent cation/H+ antiporter complex subunit F [Haloferax]|uniref:Cation:proton antiporter n=1 Tax=Haloferax marinum TaxID=2666143 RepID=A0A6A8G6M0_9EURY|nr:MULTISPECIES: monovalent cation/H+ antiporter complex subunit F [Haloferax]KAB1197857.1 cation:proton antiporter [Haloferax sp. CBA1150]MRW96920.1 cation:proton antiporter [Haloferax marinum]